MSFNLTNLRPMVRALAHRNFRLFFVGQGISLIGTWMQQIAMAWLVYRLTNSVFLLGIVGFASQIPTIFVAPFAGVMTDRCNQRNLLLLTQSLAMTQAFLLALLALTGWITVWQIVLLSIFLGIINTFDMTARQAFFLDMVPDMDDLSNAIALNSSLVNVTRLVGPAIAGLTIALTGEGGCFLLNGISYVAVLAALVSMDVSQRVARITAPLSKGLSEGVAYTLSFAPVREVLLLLALVSLMGAPFGVLLPVFARDILHGGPQTLSLLTAAGGLGALAGAIYLAGRKTMKGIGAAIVSATVVFGVGLMVFPLSHALPVSLLILLCMGCAQMVQAAGINTVLHTIVEDDKRGRVMSYYTMALVGITPLGSLLAGILADRIGAPMTVLLGGPFCLLGSWIFARKLPHLRDVAMRALQERREMEATIGSTFIEYAGMSAEKPPNALPELAHVAVGEGT